jgi:hypothetical protein
MGAEWLLKMLYTYKPFVLKVIHTQHTVCDLKTSHPKMSPGTYKVMEAI